MLMNHSEFDILEFKTEVNNLSYLRNVHIYNCFNKKTSLRVHNFLLIGSAPHKYFCIHFSDYWYEDSKDIR